MTYEVEAHWRSTESCLLALIQNYTKLTYNREVPIVVSETGGYVTGKGGKSGDALAHTIASNHFPGAGFEWEMKVRSILDFNQVSATIANNLWTEPEHDYATTRMVRIDPSLLRATNAIIKPEKRRRRS